MKKILITGGAGFIGSHLVEAFQDRCEEIRVLDNFRTGKKSNLRGLQHQLIPGSITDPEIVKAAVRGVDQVFHCAALANVPECLDNPHDCHRVNIQGLLNVLEASERQGVSSFSFASSASVYGPTPPVPTNEEAPLNPNNPYAQSKAEGEALIADFHRRGRISAVALRLFNVFGPRQDPKSGYAAAIPQFISKALRNEDITIYGDGLQTRDFVFVKDVAAAFQEASSDFENTGLFNVGGQKAIRIIDLAGKIIKLTGSSSRIRFQEPREGDARFSQACNLRLRECGWHARHGLRAALSETIASLEADTRLEISDK